ncbi:hypothetical protein EDD15DRAFT_2257232 [Pisolithus albus]|nr:hypothetical protein EDD15DRAFT_2257232 [Pisolithus albus]
MSTLLKKANVYVSKSQRPGTTEVHAERCRFDEKQSDIVIVDTPSFCTYTDPDGEVVVREWMKSYYPKPCKVARMVYMHNLASNPEDTNLRMSNHLGAFRRAYLPNPSPRTIHVVPTLPVGAKLPKERLRTLTTQLQRHANAEGARLHDTFDGEPETAWNIVQELLNVQGIGKQG